MYMNFKHLRDILTNLIGKQLQSVFFQVKDSKFLQFSQTTRKSLKHKTAFRAVTKF